MFKSIENVAVKLQKEDKSSLANELKYHLADELVNTNEEKNNRAEELIMANEEKIKRADELIIANKELAFQNKEKDKRANELVIANEEKSKRADELVIANKELAFQNKEKDRRANELAIANEEKSKRADELVIANKELAFQNKEKDRRANELVIANKEKSKRADELVIANKELAFQNIEKDRRADELVIANNEKVILLRKLQLSQKMEALGKLTGGISHEYNNMLGIISGYSQLIKLSVTKDSKLTQYANEIQLAGKRAAKLTSKLLAFSQEKSANEYSVNINTLLKRQHDMLEKALTISINLTYTLYDDLWQVWLDGSDMEDAILNLCINAMHAMNEQGKLTIETKNKRVNKLDANELNIRPGEYVLLSFTDTGCGFNEKIKEKIFDPFFTTKGELGTGLGLSIVYSFVQNSGGAVDVDSVEGEGTQFRLYFPRFEEVHCDKKSPKQNMNERDLKEKATILLVDDEPALLEVTNKILCSSGFNVFCAQDATRALKILDRENIDILISDVIMESIDGYELASIVKKKYPDIKIQIVSGFAGSRNTDMRDISLHKNMLQKPVDSGDLLSRIYELIDKKA